jgi:hypothetical protein
MTPRAKRLAQVALWLPIVIYAIKVARTYFLHADSAIALSADDALANISFALATEGRYGFLSSPVLFDIPRDQGLFSYGPFYFYVAAALIWLFGYSLTLMRAIHVAAMIGIAFAAQSWFRVVGGVVGAIIAVGLLVTLERGQWPMVRPDSMVSVFAVALVMSAGLAIRTGRSRYWAGAGFAAACGACTHLVAWSLVPSALVIFGLATLATWRREARRPAFAGPLALFALGGLGGAFLFYWSFDFRIADQLRFLSGYQSLTGSMSAMAQPEAAFAQVIRQHLKLAYWYLPYPLEYTVWATLITGLAAVGLFVWHKDLANRTESLSLLLPPVTVWVGYILSLGVYNNFHAGYAILNQVMWLWSLGAVGSAILLNLEPWPRLRQIAVAGAWTLALGLAIGVLTVFAQRTDYRTLAAGTSVSITDYTDHVLEQIPARARAWGSVVFGIEHPRRIQLVQFDDAILVVTALAPAEREAVAPDFLIWGFSENRGTALTVMGGVSEAIPTTMARLFPGARYQLLSIVDGAPYGAARVYARVTDRSRPGPDVATFDARRKRWDRGWTGEVPLSVTPATPATLVVGEGASPLSFVASQSVTGDAAAGTYLLRIDLAELPANAGAVFAASPSSSLKDAFGEYGPAFDVSPWFAGERSVRLLYRHPGGPFYVSQFGKSPGAITGVHASLLVPVPDTSAARRRPPTEHPMPASGWIHPNTLVPPDWPDQPGIRLSSGASGTVTVDGNAIQYGYQAYGPKIPVKPFSRIRLHFSITVHSGTACLGVLDGTGMRWLVVPDRLGDEYDLQVNDSETIKPVLANCSSSPDGIVPIKATIGPGRYEVWADDEAPYVDQLMNLYRQRRQPRQP